MRKKKRVISAFLAAVLTITMCDFSGMAGMSLTAEAAEVSGIANGNFDFENDLTGWDKNGTVEVKNDSPKNGSKYVHLEANSSITMTLTDIEQGSYTLSAWVKGTAGKNGNITVSGTGGPDSVSLIDTWKKGSVWNQMGHRNVLVYNGQMTITVSAGTTALDLDYLELTADSTDMNIIDNWDFENGLAYWTKSGTAAEDTAHADTGAKAVCLEADSEISQTVTVKPNTKYALTMRAKVDKQDVFETTKVESSYRKNSDRTPGIMGELQERTSLGDRVNLGVRTTDGKVLRQAPSGTEGYSLVTLTFITGAADTSVEIYANTKYDDNYKDSVTIYKAEEAGGEVKTELADNWTGNGSDNAYVDNFDLFEIQDSNYLKGADVSFLPAIEDLGGKYFANGVQQDCLRILSNHGVNSITNMMFVKAGEPAHYPDTLKTVYIDTYWGKDYWFKEDGSQAELKMIQGGYFDKEHSLELGKRATELGMSYLPSFHYSDTWMSAAKAFCPVEWLDTDYDSETGYKNTDIQHLQSMVYNYVYDFAKALADNNVNVCGVKHGNEQDGGLVRPIGSGATSEGHAKIIAASYNAVEDALPGVAGYVHTNSGYETTKFGNFFTPLKNNGAKMDGAAFSLYGGRNSGNIVKIANFMAKDENLRYLDYINVETGFTFTRYSPTIDTANSSMYQGAYYNMTPNGQYNWLLDYQQSGLDTPNPYGQTRGFYYWETDWIPTPGAGSTDGGSADVNQRIMFNNGDPAIKEMGSTQPGKAGDMMDSMYAYLIRGCSKPKTATLHTESSGEGDYAVEVAEPAGITLSKSNLTLTVGTKERLQPVVTPIDKVLTDSHITYTSADSSIAKVTKDGFVCGVKAGSTTVTASVKGGHTATVNVTVNATKAASGITLKMNDAAVTDNEVKTAEVFDKIQITSSLAGTPSNQTVVYTSSNPEVASFLGATWQTPKGQMRQETEKADTKVQLNVLDAGTTTITAASADGGASISFTLNTTKVAAQSIAVEPSEVSISYKRSTQLKATVMPEDTTRYKIRWESSDDKIATVDQNGKVTATGIGNATIKAVSDDNDAVFGSCAVHATEVRAEGVELDKKNLTIQTGSTKKLSALVSPADTHNTKVTWTSSNEQIATVNDKGEVTGVAIGGPVTITATTEDGGFQASCQVTVQKDAIPVTGVTLTENEYYFASDYFSEAESEETEPVYRLTANVEPDSATNTDVTWTSETPEVATVDEFGRVTAVSGGVAVIKATTAEGGFTAQAKVYVPSISESFDNRAEGDGWEMEIASGFSNKAAKLSGSVTAAEEGKILQLSGGGSGGRGLQKRFSQSIVNDEIILDFDWNVGTAAGSNGSYITITDSSNNRYLSIQTNNNTELVFSTGGQPADGVVLANAVAVGSGFNQNNTWYHLHVIVDMKAEKTAFTITSLANPQLTASHEVAFDAVTQYTGDVAAIQFVATRNGGLSWNPALDNVNIYKAALSITGIKVNKAKVKLIPIKDTLGAKCQLTASVLPAGVSQEVKWESSDTSLVTVDSTGLVVPVNTYDSLADIETGNCTIKVSSMRDPSVYKEIPVEISNTPNASEFFSILDESGREVYPGSEVINLSAGERKTFIPRLTGGDGDSDIAGIKWESSDRSVVSVNKDTGMVTAMGPGTAKVTLTVTMYSGEPLVGEINFNVTGAAIADTSALEAAIAAAKTAKNREDSYYTEESLATYKQALQKAENDLQSALEEKWKADKQSVLDNDVTDLNAAVAGLAKNDAIKSISINGIGERLWLNKKMQLTATVEPEDVEEQVFWSSNNTSVIVIDKNSGMAYPVGTGTATITAIGAYGKVKAQKQVTVVEMEDLTSYYDESGVVISATNTKSGREIDNAFKNVRKNDLKGGAKGEQAWSTGSSEVGIITIDLGSKARIDNVKTVFYSVMKYTLDVSDDGTNWTTKVDHSAEAAGVLNDSATEPFTDTLPADTTARYIRLNILDNTGGGWTGVTYMQANGAFVPEISYASSITCEAAQIKESGMLTAENLPSKVSAVLSSGETAELPVVWDEVSLENIKNTGKPGVYDVTGTVTVDGVAYYVVCKLTVEKDLKDAVVTLSANSYVYDGKKKTPIVTVKLAGEKVPEDGYTVEYKNNINAGIAKVEITGKNGYSGKTEKTFTITKASAVIKLKKSSIKKAYGDKNFDLGASVNSKGKITYSLNNKKVIKMVGSKAKIVGWGDVTVTVKAAATGNYNAASKKLKISVVPKKVALKSVKSKKAGQVSVNWKKDSKASGYTIYLAMNKKFKGAKKINVKSYKTVAKTVSGLKKGKTYYVKVCAYKTVKGKKISGFDSAVKKIKIKK